MSATKAARNRRLVAAWQQNGNLTRLAARYHISVPRVWQILVAAGVKQAILRQHGTVHGYSEYACRCRPCTDAWAAMCRSKRPNGWVRGEDYTPEEVETIARAKGKLVQVADERPQPPEEP